MNIPSIRRWLTVLCRLSCSPRYSEASSQLNFMTRISLLVLRLSNTREKTVHNTLEDPPADTAHSLSARDTGTDSFSRMIMTLLMFSSGQLFSLTACSPLSLRVNLPVSPNKRKAHSQSHTNLPIVLLYPEFSPETHIFSGPGPEHGWVYWRWHFWRARCLLQLCC